MQLKNTMKSTLLQGAAIALASLWALAATAAVPGITGVGTAGTASFHLVASDGWMSQPDGSAIYSFGYGCDGIAGTAFGGFLPATITTGFCPTDMQLPGPTLIVHQNDTVSITLRNNLPAVAGNTSMLFPGFKLTSVAGGVAGSLTQEAPNNVAHTGTVTYTFVADTAGTHTYYSGTQGDIQVEMGLTGAIVVIPASGNNAPAAPTPDATASAGCTTAGTGSLPSGQADFRLAAAAYDNSQTCYDREYLFQFSEVDPFIHQAVRDAVDCQNSVSVVCAANLNAVETEPYRAAYFMVNGRSMPDDMDPNYSPQYSHQPYNGNPHMHPGELTLLRIIGNGRWQHPFHEHGSHVRVLARDGQLLLSSGALGNLLGGPALFTTTTTPGQTIDGIFQWTGRGLNWDPYGHTLAANSGDGAAHTEACSPDANGYNTIHSPIPAAANADNYFEWCADHEKALESKPFGAVGGGGPISLPDPNILAAGPWFGGSPYLGPEATNRAVGATPIPPSGTVANDPGAEAGFAFMWHSHNEREITTNNAFPGGMMMMMLVDPPVYEINEAN